LLTSFWRTSASYHSAGPVLRKGGPVDHFDRIAPLPSQDRRADPRAAARRFALIDTSVLRC